MPGCSLPLSVPPVMVRSMVGTFLVGSSLIVPSSVFPSISNVYLLSLTDHLATSSRSASRSPPPCFQEATVQSPANFLRSSLSSLSLAGAASAADAPTTSQTAKTERRTFRRRTEGPGLLIPGQRPGTTGQRPGFPAPPGPTD